MNNAREHIIIKIDFVYEPEKSIKQVKIS